MASLGEKQRTFTTVLVLGLCAAECLVEAAALVVAKLHARPKKRKTGASTFGATYPSLVGRQIVHHSSSHNFHDRLVPRGAMKALSVHSLDRKRRQACALRKLAAGAVAKARSRAMRPTLSNRSGGREM